LAAGFFATGFFATGFFATGFLATDLVEAGFFATDLVEADVRVLFEAARAGDGFCFTEAVLRTPAPLTGVFLVAARPVEAAGFDTLRVVTLEAWAMLTYSFAGWAHPVRGWCDRRRPRKAPDCSGPMRPPRSPRTAPDPSREPALRLGHVETGHPQPFHARPLAADDGDRRRRDTERGRDRDPGGLRRATVDGWCGNPYLQRVAVAPDDLRAPAAGQHVYVYDHTTVDAFDYGTQ
jgi:hypothetical protein